MHRLGVSLLAALLATGCGKVSVDEQDAGSDVHGPPLAISTESLASGTVGAQYQQQLAASGGAKPYGWSIGSKGQELAWLRVDPVSGILSGTPTLATVAAPVTVVVTDQNAATASRDFVLTVDACKPGDTTQCTSGSDAGCTVGVLTCENGAFPGTCTGELSNSTEHCGPDCGACGPSADACVGGNCLCGNGPACDDGNLCCNGVCVDPGDPRTCGTCANDCTKQAGANAVATCAEGQCSFACKADYLNCAPGSTPQDGCEKHISDDLQNCGACNHLCAVNTNTGSTYPPTCEAGVCKAACQAQYLDCDNNIEDGCEIQRSPTNCASCGQTCHPAGSDNVANPTCVADKSGAWSCIPTCNAGYASCDGVDSNGCEINLKNDLNHCGSCTSQCKSVGGSTVACQNGTCHVTACANGALDCDGDASNGCEVAANPCGCGCAPGDVCTATGCQYCNHCGGLPFCCFESCQYCPGAGIQCGPCN